MNETLIELVAQLDETTQNLQACFLVNIRKAFELPQDKRFEEQLENGPTVEFNCTSCQESYKIRLTIVPADVFVASDPQEQDENVDFFPEGIVESLEEEPSPREEIVVYSSSLPPPIDENEAVEEVETDPIEEEAEEALQPVLEPTPEKMEKKGRKKVQEINLMPSNIPCNICGVRLKYEVNLRRHIRRAHSNEYNFPCDICNKVLSNNWNLRHHKVAIHGEETEFQCPRCLKFFLSETILNLHLERRNQPHTGEPKLRQVYACRPVAGTNIKKSYSCQICDKKFANRVSRTIHMKEKHGTPPIACQDCDMRFWAIRNLYSHRSYHHGPNAITMTCLICSKVCKSERSLEEHQLTHKKPQFSCQYCGRNFRQHSNLLRHVNAVHTKKIKYTCEICEKVFYQADSLTHHRRIHTGEKPFECRFCSKTYIDCSSKIKHERMHLDGKTFRPRRSSSND